MKNQHHQNRARHRRKKPWSTHSAKSHRQREEKLQSSMSLAKANPQIDWENSEEDDFEFLPALFHFLPSLVDQISCISLRSCDQASVPIRLQRSQHLFGQNYVFWKEENFDADFLTENVAKKMEFVLGALKEKLRPKKKMIISGYLDSSYLLDAAILALAMQMKPVVYVLKSRISKTEWLRLLQLRKSGVSFKFFDSKASMDWALKRQNFYSFFNHRNILSFGGEDFIGALGYMSSLLELSQQPLPEFDFLMIPVDSGVSWLGLELGRQFLGWENVKIVGFSTRHEVGELKVKLADQARALIEVLRPKMDISWFREFDLSSMMIFGASIQDPEKNLRWMNRFQELEGFDIDLLRVAPTLMEATHWIRQKKIADKKILFWNTGPHLSANLEAIDFSAQPLARAIRKWPKTPDLEALLRV